MKVLWTHNFNPSIRNAGSFMYILAEYLQKFKVDLDLLYLGNLRSPGNILRARRMVKDTAKKYDIIHSQFGSACAFVTSVVDDIPKVLTLRGSDWYRYKGRNLFLFIHSWLATIFTQSAIQKFDMVITVSHRMKKEIQRKYPKIKVFFMPSPIELEKFKPIDKHTARATLGFPNDHDKWVLFTTISTRNPVKRVDLARKSVEIANQLMNGSLKIKIRIASGVPHNEMPLFVASCDLALCTSTHEGWPNSIKEALACNIPFVATDVDDLYLIANKEPSCRICPPDAHVIAKNITEVLMIKEPKNLRRYVIEMDAPVISRKLLNFYESLLKEYKDRRP